MEIIAISPSKRFEIQVEAWEARNSLWVNSPVIWDAEQSSTIFSFKDECWSLDSATWVGDSTVRLLLRKFPGNHSPDHIRVEVSCIATTALVHGTAGMAAFSTRLDELEVALDHKLKWT